MPDGKLQVILRRSLELSSMQGDLILLPLGREWAARCAGQHCAACVADKRDLDGTDRRRIGLRVERALVGGIRPHGHAPEAIVAHAWLMLLVRVRCLQPETARDRLAWPGALIQRDRSFGMTLVDERPMRDAGPAVVCKGAIAHHLGVKTAIVGVVDLLGHQTIEGWTDG